MFFNKKYFLTSSFSLFSKLRSSCCLGLKKFFEPQMHQYQLTYCYSYESAVCLLNNLQSNPSVLAKIKAQSSGKSQRLTEQNIPKTEKYLKRTGILVSDLDKLNIIHVTGTKGKGSTCALTESILRQYGYKTGFFSSPHLVHVRERIRINGCALSEECFAKYFHKVYNSLKFACDIENDRMPAYFKFLTVMAFNVFLAENVDVAIVEVGIGGTYDCTNVINKPVVCGITTLDFDHTKILGNTLEEIAWQKAGICKSGSLCLTVPQSTASAMSVLCKRAEELSCPLYLVPGVNEYLWPGDKVKCGIPGKQQYWNITLAVQLAKIWLENVKGGNIDNSSFDCMEKSPNVVDQDEDQRTTAESGLCKLPPVLTGFEVAKPVLRGIESCRWPGRSHIVRKEKVTYYLDGAHTPKSIEYCAEWFCEAFEAECENFGLYSPVKILIFHCTADRNPETLLSYLLGCDFDAAIFCPTSVHNRQDPRSSQANFTWTQESDYKKAVRNQKVWTNLLRNTGGTKNSTTPPTPRRKAALGMILNKFT